MVAAYIETIAPLSLGAILAAWRAESPDGGVLALVAERERARLAEIQQMARDAGYPLVGAVFPALITNNQFAEAGVVLLRFEHMPSYALISLPKNLSAQQAAEHMVSRLPSSVADRKQTLFMFFDAMIPNIASILDSLYLQLADRVNYAGANAGSESFQPIPCLFDDADIVEHGVLALLLDTPSGAVLEHGYKAPPNTMTATAAEGNKVTYIDWMPALDIYRRLAREEFGVSVEPGNFYDYAVHYPLGIIRLGGDVLVRIPVALDDQGALFCVGEIPDNSLLTVLRAADAGSHETADTLAAKLDNCIPSDTLLLFYCAGRRMHMGNAAADELRTVAQKLPNSHIVGAVSLGEIGQAGANNVPLFQNATLVALPWPCA